MEISYCCEEGQGCGLCIKKKIRPTTDVAELLMVGGSALFDVSVDIHPYNNSQYITLIKLPSPSPLPALFKSSISKQWMDG